MDWIDLALSLLDWIQYWRFNLCFWGSLILAVMAYNAIPYNPLRWIVAGGIAAVGVVIGYRWQYCRYR